MNISTKISKDGSLRPPEHFLLLFQAREAPGSKWTILQQTADWDVHSWPIKYGIVGLDYCDFNASLFWKWIFLKESIYIYINNVIIAQMKDETYDPIF